jgi:ATP-dependent DNA helicase UvrD/PcrA
MPPYTLDLPGGTILEATDEQAAIIEYALHNQRSLLINAGPGTAKTSTLRFLAKYLSVVPVLNLTYNKRNAEESTKVMPGHIKCATVNSIGHRVWSTSLGGKKVVLDTKKNYNIVKELIDALPRQRRTEAYELFGDITKTMSQAKLQGYIPPTVTMGQSLATEDQFFGGLDEPPDGWFMDLVNTGLRASIRQAYGGLIDFDDQIYMSTLFGGAFPKYPRVWVDESQDLNALNHAMLKRLVGPGTVLTAVGDPYQSIYAFRGAVTSSMAALQRQFNMHEMTLSVSFRCPVAIIQRARSRAPHLQWAPWAKPGHVETLDTWHAKAIPDGAAILCRNNAPLLTCALALLRQGRGVKLVGTELGPQLVRALKRLSDNLKMPQEEVYAAINHWEADKLRTSRSPGAIADRAECLRVFAGWGPDLGAAVAHAEFIFAKEGPIQLLSGHKAKGLEWPVVYHLDPHRIPSPWSREGEALEQELNVRYVIETRAKEALYLVRLDTLQNGD